MGNQLADTQAPTPNALAELSYLVTALTDLLDLKNTALRNAAETFGRYAELHAAKERTLENERKVQNNLSLAESARQALSASLPELWHVREKNLYVGITSLYQQLADAHKVQADILSKLFSTHERAAQERTSADADYKQCSGVLNDAERRIEGLEATIDLVTSQRDMAMRTLQKFMVLEGELWNDTRVAEAFRTARQLTNAHRG